MMHFLAQLDDVIQTGANDVYQVVMRRRKEILIPADPSVYSEVDVEEGRMKVHLLEGLGVACIFKYRHCFRK